MVKHWLLAVYLALLCITSPAAELRVQLSTPQIEMGKFIKAKIIYTGDHSPGSANLQQWQDDFVIDRRDTEVENLLSGEIQTTENIRIYPRVIGERVLEAIALGGAFAAPVNVTVNPMIRNTVDGTPRWLPVPKQIWQGQSMEIEIGLALLHPSNHIAVEQARFTGFDSETLPRRINDNGKRVTLRWRITAQRAGQFYLDPPAIEQRGRGRWRYYLPKVEIDVLPLPAYLPPTLPVGEVVIRTRLIQGTAGPAWQLELTNQGALPDEVYGIRTQLAALGHTSVENVMLIPTDETYPTDLRARQTYQVAVPNWSWGLGSGPDIHVSFFDTHSGRLGSLTAHLPPVWRIPHLFSKLLIATAGFIMLFVVYQLYFAARRLIKVRQYKQNLRRAVDVHDLRHLLLQPGGFPTLQDWAAQQHSQRASQLAARLNALCFSAHARENLDELKQELVALAGKHGLMLQ